MQKLSERLSYSNEHTEVFQTALLKNTFRLGLCFSSLGFSVAFHLFSSYDYNFHPSVLSPAVVCIVRSNRLIIALTFRFDPVVGNSLSDGIRFYRIGPGQRNSLVYFLRSNIVSMAKH